MSAVACSCYCRRGASTIRTRRKRVDFLAADQASPPAKGGILFVGSSIFRLWTSVPGQMAPLPVLNRAFGGSRTGDQLDRFDSILDGLAEALNEAVADAAREGARAAVKEILTELLTNPQLAGLLHQATPPAASHSAAPAPRPDALRDR